MSDFHVRLKALADRPAFRKWHRGVEKEALRVTRRGELSSNPHPPSLGSPLTHPKITTDFSEAQMEFITGVHDSSGDCLTELDVLHRFAYSKIRYEYLWPASMPCFMGSDKDVPIAQYGESNAAKVKSIYRMGLGNRYGRKMQTISGIHYNFSFSDEFFEAYAIVLDEVNNDAFRNRCYLDLIRNFRRFAWLPIYLFGASPAVCKSFAPSSVENLLEFDAGSYFLSHATSLRMGPMGYQSSDQTERYVSYNSLDDYIRTLLPLLTEEFEPYVEIGLKDGDDYHQLNTALLQIEAEFYGTIRAKRKADAGERPLEALNRRGIEYVEVRCLDLDPFHPVGIAQETMEFLDMFLVYCLLAASPLDHIDQSRENVLNQQQVVSRGREPDLLLSNHGQKRDIGDWALDILGDVYQLAERLDRSADSTDCDASDFRSIVRSQLEKARDPELTPSEKVLASMRDMDMSYSSWGLYQARMHQDHYEQNRVDSITAAQLEDLSTQSLADQQAMEVADHEPFDSYLHRYMKLDV